MSGAHRNGGHRRLVASVTTAVLAVAGVAALVFGLVSQDVAPAPASTAQPAASSGEGGAPPAPSTSERGTPAPAPGQSAGEALPASEPTALSIPAIGVESTLITVGQNPDGTIHVPQPGPNYDKAAWYEYSPTPGEVGPSVLLGHIDSAENGPSVFYRLAEMQPGQEVSVTRADGTVAVFTVDRVEKYPKADFPTLEVYGNTPNPQLRLITCGGTFNEDSGNYRSNIVVYAHLTGSHRV